MSKSGMASYEASSSSSSELDSTTAIRLSLGTHPDPFAALGPTSDSRRIVAHIPGAERVWVVNNTDEVELSAHPSAEAVFSGDLLPYYRLRIEWPGGFTEEREDPYRFGPVLGEIDEYLIGEGSHRRLWEP